MGSQLPARRVRLAPGFVKLLAAEKLQAHIIIRYPDVGLREPCRSFRDGAVRVHLYTADAHPFVPETGMNPRSHKMIERTGGDVTIRTHREFAGIARVLVALNVLRRGVGIARGGDSLAGKELGDQRGGLSIVLARILIRNEFEKDLHPGIAHETCKVTRGIVLEAATGRIGRLVVD